MSDELITIAAFPNPVLANIVKGFLESEGIDCFIANEEIFGIHAGHALIDGGVKVRVRESDVERARAALAEAELETP
jgi:hypothetical protein